MQMRAIGVVACLLIVQAGARAESIPLIKFDPGVSGTFVEPANNKTWGYSFYVTTPVTVTHLAWYDMGGDGLSHSHQVGVWKDTSGISQANWPTTPWPSGNMLMASAIIPAGTIAELSGPWRRVPIVPVTLGVGGYSVGGQNNASSTDDMVYKLFGAFGTSYPALMDSRVLAGSFTDNTSGADGFYAPGTNGSGWYLASGTETGATLFLEAIPEPSSLALSLALVGMLVGSARSRLRSITHVR